MEEEEGMRGNNAFSSDKNLNGVLIIAKELMLIMEEYCVILFIEQSGFVIKLFTVNYFSPYYFKLLNESYF